MQTGIEDVPSSSFNNLSWSIILNLRVDALPNALLLTRIVIFHCIVFYFILLN